MSMTQTLAPHLPYLRRYARALTGSQASGDAHVRAALTALLEGDESLTEGVPPRVGLYRLFHAIWQSGAEHYDEAEAGTPENRLKALSASKRAALLLTAVEAFSPEEAAFIIDETPAEVEAAILDAQGARLALSGAFAQTYINLYLAYVDGDQTVSVRR